MATVPTPRPSVAIVGGGIAGMACAYLLRERYDVTLFDKNAHIGGHTNTITVTEGGQPIPIDTGFMVFNHHTYPLLTKLFQALDVPTQPTDMSFSVQQTAIGLEWNGAGFDKLFAQRRNLVNVRFWAMLFQMNRFCQEAKALMAAPETAPPELATQTLGEYVAARGYGEDFLNWFLSPMSAAIWSCRPEQTLAFPARTLLYFFYNHGFLGLHDHYQWYTVTGGAKRYVEKLMAAVGPERFLPTTGVQRVQPHPDGTPGVTVITDEGPREFDHVILATHADEALALLATPTPLEQSLLGLFGYEANTATLHSDASVMPKTERAWAAWNYRVSPRATGNGVHASTHYWMNRLQALPTDTPYVVSINGQDLVDPERIHYQTQYTHPRFTVAAIAAQPRLAELNRQGNGLYFCGSYFRYGFHEDALMAAVSACEALTGGPVW